MVRGHKPHEKLGDLMGAVTDYGTRTAEHSSVNAEEISEMSGSGKASRWNLSAGLATLVSVVALLFSGFSFYETVLKQANLRVYAPPVVYMYREHFRDIFAIPITLSNDGAQRGTVLSVDLEVKNLLTNKVTTFQGLSFGDNIKGDRRMFHPITVAGRNSFSDVVLFHAHETGSFVETTGGVKLPLQMTLKINPETSGGLFGVKAPKPLTFNMTAQYIASLPDMERGTATKLYDERWQKSKVKSGK